MKTICLIPLDVKIIYMVCQRLYRKCNAASLLTVAMFQTLSLSAGVHPLLSLLGTLGWF